MTAIIFRLGRPTSVLSSPGLTGRSSNHRPWILDCQSKSDASDFDHLASAEVGQARLRVKPGNDTSRVNPSKHALAARFDVAAHRYHPGRHGLLQDDHRLRLRRGEDEKETPQLASFAKVAVYCRVGDELNVGFAGGPFPGGIAGLVEGAFRGTRMNIRKRFRKCSVSKGPKRRILVTISEPA